MRCDYRTYIKGDFHTHATKEVATRKKVNIHCGNFKTRSLMNILLTYKRYSILTGMYDIKAKGNKLNSHTTRHPFKLSYQQSRWNTFTARQNKVKAEFKSKNAHNEIEVKTFFHFIDLPLLTVSFKHSIQQEVYVKFSFMLYTFI